MGDLYIEEYGISKEGAALDPIGVDPNYQRKDIGGRLIDGFMDH